MAALAAAGEKAEAAARAEEDTGNGTRAASRERPLSRASSQHADVPAGADRPAIPKGVAFKDDDLPPVSIDGDTPVALFCNG